MHSTIGQAAIVGIGIGAAAIAIRATLGDAPMYMQLLAVCAAGVALAVVQLVLGRSFTRSKRLTATRPPAALRPPVQPRPPSARSAAPLADRDSGWTGLAASSPLAQPEPPQPSQPEPPQPEPPR